jgi:ABC-type Na+ efflux pump permease subunit
MNWRAIRAVIRKDLQVVTRSKMVMLPTIIVSLMMLVLMPLFFSFLGSTFVDDITASSRNDIEEILSAAPAALVARFDGLNEQQIWLTYSLIYMLAPLYLTVPMMVSSVIAADSFVGERERKTMEALLHTPITNIELLLAKMLTAWLSALTVSLLGFVLYSIVANAVGYKIMGGLFFPTPMWLILVLWVAPGVAALGLGATVLVSTRVSTFQEAYQVGGIAIVPIVALVIGQSAGLMFFSEVLTALLGLVVWFIAGILLWIGWDTFDRDRLISKL